MIVLDTHIWVWWTHNDPQLTQRQKAWIQEHEARHQWFGQLTGNQANLRAGKQAPVMRQFTACHRLRCAGERVP